MIKFQYYPADIETGKPLGFVTLDQFIQAHKNPSEKTRLVFSFIADAEAAGDMKQKAELKQKNLHYFTPCVHIDSWRKYDNITTFTGLLVLDFDHMESVEYAEAFKSFLIAEYDCMIACWLSPSKRGVKALVSIPVVDTVEQFKAYYYGIAEEMQQYKGFDSSGQNCVLPLFQSYDPGLLHRDDFSSWTVKGEKANTFNYKENTTAPDIDISDRDKQTVVKIIHTGMEAINDPGHPQLRALCLTIGGYIASGYIEQYEAIQLIDHLIETHHYLSKGVKGYQQTARWAISNGKNRPLWLKKNT